MWTRFLSQIFPRAGEMNKFEDDDDVMFTISGLEVGDGAKADVPTTDRQNEKKTCIAWSGWRACALPLKKGFPC